MATYQQLQNDVASWLNRQDIIALGLIPGWVSMVETEISETLRSRFQVAFVTQNIDAPYITLPVDFATMESIRDAVTGELLELKDEWSGSWTSHYMPSAWNFYPQPNITSPSVAYRLLGSCVEFLPHPVVPDPPDPTWIPQQVLMGYYQRPAPLVLPTDTNPILDNLYGVYLYGLMKIGALFEMDADRAQQADAQWQQTVTRANLWKQQSDYSGAPFREEMAIRY